MKNRKKVTRLFFNLNAVKYSTLSDPALYFLMLEHIHLKDF